MVIGLLGAARRQAAAWVRVEVFAPWGSVSFGGSARVTLGGREAAGCVGDLLEAAAVRAACPHAVGSFVHRGGRCEIEVRPTAGGRVAEIDLATSSRGRSLAPWGRPLVAHLAADLQTLHGADLTPEELAAVVRRAEGGGAERALERHGDLVLLALARRARGMGGAIERLVTALEAGCAAAGPESIAPTLAALVRAGRSRRRGRAAQARRLVARVLARISPTRAAVLRLACAVRSPRSGP